MRATAILFGLLLLGGSLLKEPLHPAWSAWPIRSALAAALGLALAWLPALAPLRRRLAGAVFDSGARVFHAVLFLAGFSVAAALAWFVFHGLPRLDDGVAAIFQARIFARGHVVWPLPEHAEFFRCFGVLARSVGHWCGMYPPGWSLLLVPGVLLGATWLVNPVLFGALCVVTSKLGEEVYDRRVGRLAGLLVLTSPLLAVLGGEQLSHVPTALFLTLCAWSICRLVRTGGAGWGALAGAAWGMAFLCRPLTALVVGLGLGLWVLFHPRAAVAAWRGLALAFLLAGGAGGLQAAFQHATTGDWNRAGHEIGLGARGRMGFGRLDRARTHTPELAVEYTLRRLRNINHHQLGGPLPFYLIALWPFLAGWARGRESWLLLPSLGLLGAFSLFWYYEIYYPSRYISEATPLLLVLAARALVGRARLGIGGGAAGLLAAGWCFAAVSGTPWLLRQFHDNYGDVESVLPRVVRAYDIRQAVVFMDQVGEGTDQFDPRNKYYATGFLRNDLDLRGDVIYALNRREKNIDLMRAYPDRSYFLYRFDRTTSRAFLYRLWPEGESHRTEPVPPGADGLLLPAPPAD